MHSYTFNPERMFKSHLKCQMQGQEGVLVSCYIFTHHTRCEILHTIVYWTLK